MTEVAIIGDGLAGHLLARGCHDAGVDFVWAGAGEPTLPPVGLLHRHVGRSFDSGLPEQAAWRAADAWARGLSTDVATSVTMFRPTSRDSRLSSTFDLLELDHVREEEASDHPWLAPCQRLFVYDDAWSVAVGAALREIAPFEPTHGALRALEPTAAGGWRLTTDGATVEVEHVVFATGPATPQWFDGLGLKDRPGELALVERPAELPANVAVSRNGHLGPDPTGRFVCVGATYRERDAERRGVPETAAACLDGIARSVPSLVEARPVDAWFGVRAVAHPDRRPLAGPTGIDGLWLAAGLASKGLLWGARVAEVVLAGVLGGDEVPAETDPRRQGQLRLRGVS